MTSTSPVPLPASIDATLALLKSGDYVADRALATVLFLALKMGRPVLLEGEAGVGKTEIAKVLAKALAATSSASSATRASTSRRRSMSGTMPAR